MNPKTTLNMKVYGKVIEFTLANANDRVYLKDEKAIDIINEYQSWAETAIDLFGKTPKITYETLDNAAKMLHEELQELLSDRYIINLILIER